MCSGYFAPTKILFTLIFKTTNKIDLANVSAEFKSLVELIQLLVISF